MSEGARENAPAYDILAAGGLVGGINPYSYANNNPLVFVDRDGQIAVNPVTGAVAGAIGGMAGAFIGTLVGGGSLGDAFSVLGEGALTGAAAGGIGGAFPMNRLLGFGGAVGAELLFNGATGATAGKTQPPQKPNPRKDPNLPRVPLPGGSSPGPVSGDILKKFCELNPGALQCRSSQYCE